MNTETLLIVAITAVLVWVPLYAFYWWIIRPAFLAKLERHLSEQESVILAELLASERPDRMSALRVLRERAQRARIAIPEISFPRLFLREISKRTKSLCEAEQIVLAKADKEIRQMETELSLKLYFAILINSPTIAGVGLCIVALMAMVSAFSRAFNFISRLAWGTTLRDCEPFSGASHASA